MHPQTHGCTHSQTTHTKNKCLIIFYVHRELRTISQRTKRQSSVKKQIVYEHKIYTVG